MHHSALFFSLPLLLPFQNPGCEDFEILRFFPLCVGTSMGFYDFFPVDGDFEILRFFTCVCGPCVGDFENFQKKSPIWKNPGSGDLKWQ